MMNRLLGKKAIIIGGTSGIGKAIVKKFSHEGATVAFCGRSKDKGMQIQNEGLNGKYFYCDIRDQQSIKEFFSLAL